MDNVKMMADAYELRKAIEAETVEVEENGIKVVMGGDLKIKKISVGDSEHTAMKDAINSAIRKTQEMQVLKLKEIVDLEGIS